MKIGKIIIGSIGVVCGVIGLLITHPFNPWILTATIWPLAFTIGAIGE